MKIPLWLIALLFAGYTVWCANFWHNHCKERCCNETTEVSTSTGEPAFLWNSERPVADNKFPDWKKGLLSKGGQGDTLVITTWYRAGEPGGEKLAMARAEALKAMMMPEMPANRIRIATKMVADDGLVEGAAAKPSADFSWLKMMLKADQGAIIESDNDITFLFPTNSSERDRNQEVENYLKQLVAKHKTTTNTFSIVGYTDDVGEPEENLRLGRLRANSIALYLSKNGIDSKRITVDSKGEANPVADNATEDGRHQNRRVVLTVNR